VLFSSAHRLTFTAFHVKFFLARVCFSVNLMSHYFRDGSVSILATLRYRCLNYAADSIPCSEERGRREKVTSFVMHLSLCCQIFAFVSDYNREQYKTPLRNPWLRSHSSKEDCSQLRSCSWLWVITKEITVDTTKCKCILLLQHVSTLKAHNRAKIHLC
jgi:hypothetical protein